MNVLNVIFAYFIFMAAIQVHEKLLCTNDYFFFSKYILCSLPAEKSLLT